MKKKEGKLRAPGRKFESNLKNGGKELGTWNETCMLSYLPVLEGDVVGAVLLAQNKDSMRTSYPDEIWKPISPVIVGHYDGHGRIADIRDWSDLETCYRNLGQKGQLKFFAEGNEIPYDALRLGTLIEYAEHDELLVQYKTPIWEQRRKVTLALMRNDILQYVYEAKADCRKKFVELCVQGRPLEDPAAGRSVHIILKRLHENKVSVADIKAIDSFMLGLRMQWGPTSGAGSQREIEEPWQVNFYRQMAEKAEEMLREYKSSSK